MADQSALMITFFIKQNRVFSKLLKQKACVHLQIHIFWIKNNISIGILCSATASSPHDAGLQCKQVKINRI